MRKVSFFMAAACAAAFLSATPFHADEKIERVVVLGFDGADAALTEQWMAEGHLPNLAELRAKGGYAPILPPNPPQTPVSWAVLATGLDPGETNVFDFLKRAEGKYNPTFAMMTEGSKPFLWGKKNPLYLGLLAALAAGVVIGTSAALFRARWPWAVCAGALAAAAAFYPAQARAAQWIPTQVPNPVNNREGQTMWGALSDAGRCSHVFRMPTTFPPDELSCGWMLAGLGVPDVRGRVGTPSYYTTALDFTGDANKFSVEIFELPEFDDSAETKIYGPATAELFPKGEGFPETDYPRRLDVPLTLKRTGEKEVTASWQGQSLVLREGKWSPWFRVEFRFNPVLKFSGASRFHLLSARPLKLNLLPVNFHPADSPVPLTHPKSFARGLFDRFGVFKTIGWVTDTWSLDQGLTDEDAFLKEMYDTVEQDLAMMRAFLDEPRRPPLYMQVFEFTDRIGHMFWRFLDPEHPRHDAALAERYAGEMLKAYQKMDEIVGEAMRRSDDKTLLLVVSDHGFGTWRRSINYNTWLRRQGLLTLFGDAAGEKTLEDLFDGGEFFENVDWSRTKAYALGLGSIYVNLRGREPKGIVEPGEEYESVRRAIVEGLESLVDEETGLRPVHRVYRREDMYRSFAPDAPDLRAANRPPYRVSWQTSLGGSPKELFETNDTGNWSADHCSLDPELVKGVLFSSRPLSFHDPSVLDVYPTVLRALGESVSDVPGRDLLAAR